VPGLAPSAALTSANRESTWNQRRPLIAYWRTENQVAVFKAQWLMDGRDMPAIRLATSQTANRLLLSLYPLYGTGPFHPSFGVPADHTFTASDFRLRFSLNGPRAKAAQLSPSRFDLACGDHHVVIDIAPSTFSSRPVKWAIHQEDGSAVLDAICASEPATVNFKTLHFRLAAAIQLLPLAEAPADFPIQISDSSSEQNISWPGANVEPLKIPTHPQTWSW
jgi:hypothetical protein